MHETSKSIPRRLRDVQYIRYFTGNGIDVGCGKDSIGQYAALFPLMGKVQAWDLQQGDAQTLVGVPEASLDWLHSSHCLEHLRDPLQALARWCEVVRPGGHLVVIVPDEDMYEQGSWPSRWNGDHKHTFTVGKARGERREAAGRKELPSSGLSPVACGLSWSPVSINVTDLVAHVADLAQCLRIELLEATWLPDQPGVDQTLGPVAECAIEFVLRRMCR